MHTQPHNEDIELLIFISASPWPWVVVKSRESQWRHKQIIESELFGVLCVYRLRGGYSCFSFSISMEKGGWVFGVFRELESHVTEAIKGQSRFHSWTYLGN
jgi:hypothetical protein